ncbi:MAG TPA: hydroxysqualene dehydroxylase HpnE [Myxococcota bacterium]|nr:hydroxysqualene dehydroxylase HpnE [Myxococcota bacterium]
MSERRIAVVGGGLAGLSAAIACGDAGARVTLFEARTRLGGATWSSERDGLWIDNGQHVFLRCCESYIAFLRRLGAFELVTLQQKLDIPVLMPGRRALRLRCGALPAPLHLAGSLLRYTHVSLLDRARIARAALALRALDPDDPKLDARSFGDWLRERGQSEAAIERFWDLFTRATINLRPQDASLALAAMVFQVGLLRDARAGEIGISKVPLTQLHEQPARRALAELGAELRLREPVDGVECGPRGELSLRARGGAHAFDAVIVATPHDVAAQILPDAAKVDRAALRALGVSPIVNLHIVYDRVVMREPFAAGVATPMQWIFDRTAAAGVKRGQCLTVSLSVADAYVGSSREKLRAEFEPALQQLFPAARDARILEFFVTCERAATFRAAPGTAALRPKAQTGVRGIALAGAWTDTGWPATMEGAVRSGNRAARIALQAVGVSDRIPEAAAA